LHEACRGHGDKWKNHQLALLRFLVARRPQSPEVPDVHGATPLHIAVAQGPSSTLGIVKFLAEKSSKSLQFKEFHGMLPVHIAAASGAPLDVPYYLTAKRPESIYGGNPRPRTAPDFPQPRKRPRPDSMS
jgi:Ankyrin repeats (3 copies)